MSPTIAERANPPRSKRSLQYSIAWGIKIVPRDFVTGLSKFDQQPTGPARRFEQSLDGPVRVLLKHLLEKIEFCLPVRTEQKVVVFGIVVEMSLQSFHESVREWKNCRALKAQCNADCAQTEFSCREKTHSGRNCRSGLFTLLELTNHPFFH